LAQKSRTLKTDRRTECNAIHVVRHTHSTDESRAIKPRPKFDSVTKTLHTYSLLLIDFWPPTFEPVT